MEPRTASALTGVLRAATAVEEELHLISVAHPREGFPHSKLIVSLPEPGQIRRSTDAFCKEILGYEERHAFTTLTATAKQLSSLHLAAQGLRSAVEWSSHFTSIDSWVSRRIGELGLKEKVVLVAPGRLGDFSIERTSRFGDLILELGKEVVYSPTSEASSPLNFDNAVMLSPMSVYYAFLRPTGSLPHGTHLSWDMSWLISNIPIQPFETG